MLGPVAMSRQTPTTQIPTAEDAIINSEDALLLGYVYRLQGTVVASLFKQFASAYGISIAQPSLRHAILAYGASIVSVSERSYFHKVQACSILVKKVKRQSTLIDADAFAAFILSYAHATADGRSEYIYKAV